MPRSELDPERGRTPDDAVWRNAQDPGAATATEDARDGHQQQQTGGNAPHGADASPAVPAGRRSDRDWQKAEPRDESSPDETSTSMPGTAALCLTFSGCRKRHVPLWAPPGLDLWTCLCRSTLGCCSSRKDHDLDAVRQEWSNPGENLLLHSHSNVRDKVNRQPKGTRWGGAGLTGDPLQCNGSAPMTDV